MDGKNAWKIYLRDKRKHVSPNSAQSEAVCAGALDVQLAGDAVYFGKVYKRIISAMQSVRLNRRIFFVPEINVYDNDTDDGCLWRFIVMDF